MSAENHVKLFLTAALLLYFIGTAASKFPTAFGIICWGASALCFAIAFWIWARSH